MIKSTGHEHTLKFKRFHWIGDSKIVKKDGESNSMETSPSEIPADPPLAAPPAEAAAANGN